MAKPPLYRPPGSGPIHPITVNAYTQLAKGTALRKTTVNQATSQAAAPASPATLGATLPLKISDGVLSLARAATTADGFLAASDWDIFNAKEPALGSPGTDGFALVSLASGARSWARCSTQAHAIAAKTGTYAATSTDEVLTGDATGGAFSITLPTAAGIAGRAYTIKRLNAGANAVTVATTGGQTIDGAATFALSAQWQVLRVISDGANWLTI